MPSTSCCESKGAGGSRRNILTWCRSLGDPRKTRLGTCPYCSWRWDRPLVAAFVPHLTVDLLGENLDHKV